MQSVCRMVLVWTVLSASLAASRGINGFSIKLAAGVLWTGTRRCISTLAAAEEAIVLIGCASMRAPWGSPFTPGRETAASGAGITIASPQEGQLIWVPAPELSTANSCSHLGQLKMTSIRRLSRHLVIGDL